MQVPLTIADHLYRAETVYGDRIGYVDEPDQPATPVGEVTYAAMGTRARAMAAGLDRLGLGRGERVAVLTPNAGRLLESFWGVSAFGRILVPINFRLQPAEVDYIIGHSGASVLLVDPELDEATRAISTKYRWVLGRESDQELLHFGTEPEPWLEVDENATATINYTSGTTARPKGVEMTHRNLWTNAATFGWHAQVNDRDVYLHTLPMFHCNGWGMPYATAAMGVTQVVLRKVDGAEILRRVERHGVTLMCGAPAVANAILEAAGDWDGPIPGKGRTRIVCAGAPPPSRTIARIESELGWTFMQIYGLTETSPLLTFNSQRAEHDHLPIEERAKLLSRAGAPALGVRLELSDQGEVLACSNHVLKGYWDQPEATADALEGGWFHTGDGGTHDGGYLTISDRKKDVIITGGENVSSIEVEDALFAHPDVAEVAVIGVPSEKWGEEVKALVVLTPGSGATETDVLAFVRERLAHYKCPKTVEFRESIPRTATGKIQKFKLRADFWPSEGRQVN